MSRQILHSLKATSKASMRNGRVVKVGVMLGVHLLRDMDMAPCLRPEASFTAASTDVEQVYITTVR